MARLPLQDIPVTDIKGVGGKFAITLEKLGIVTLQDLLFHLPIRYLDRTRITPIGQLQLNTSVVIQGRVLSSHIAMGRRRSLVCNVEDATGSTTLRFFHFNAAQKNRLQPGTELRIYGDPRLGSTGLEFYHPEYDYIEAGMQLPVDACLTPVYGLTEGVGQTRLRKIVEQGLAYLDTSPPQELLPVEVNTRFGVSSLRHALHFLHQPPAGAPVQQIQAGEHPCQQRLAYEEMLAHYLATLGVRERLYTEKSPQIKVHPEVGDQLVARLPFSLTCAQQRVIADIRQDFAKDKPMLRMVQGDVGSGKTLVAAMVALDAAASDYQVAVVAPTEILAEQHFRNFSEWVTALGYPVAWLVGKQGVVQRRQSLADIASGHAKIIVGTHALFQETVEFNRLGLAIIDEQHRFGVHQRLTLRKKTRGGETPHQLIMTATPIPRTLAMTSYADLDYSIIDELPPGRTPVNTVMISQSRRDSVVERIRNACAEGKQVYWVCPLVEESETLSAANAEDTATTLREELVGVGVGLVHGRLKAAEKEGVMATFKAGDLQVLVATTVIEVGVDVPNASVMVIENPERLGLAQLHQLRGRVGRGSVASHCVLLYGSPLSQHAKDRLQVLRETNDGFVIAERDLQLRGPGELLGTRQTGDQQYKLADLLRDGHMLDDIHATGDRLFFESRQTANAIVLRWLGKSQAYAQV